MQTNCLLFVLILLLVLGCSPTRTPLGLAADYLPSSSGLRQGIVNKYYFHYTSNDGYEKTTSIEYRRYQLSPRGHLLIEVFDPGYQLLRRRQFQFNNDQMQIVEDIAIIRTADTFPATILADHFLNWREGVSVYRSRTDYEQFGEAEVKEERTPYPDTLILDRPTKRFLRTRVRTFYPPEKAPSTTYTEFIDTYVRGIGLFQVRAEFEEGTGILELVEQMPGSEFEQLRREAPKRVAYIDPTNRLDVNNDFSPCDSPNKIYDYYNGDPDGGYPGGKKALWEALEPQLNPPLLANTSGYLTFRFVINCEGQTGWFITEEADLDFQQTEFPSELKEYLLQLIQNLPTAWRACEIRGEPVDTYAYLTFKFQDGELIELLP